MSNRNDDEGRRLGDALHGQVDSMSDAPLSFDDVAGRARSLRRNRRVAVGVGVAAAVAVIVPTAMFAGGGLPRTGDPDTSDFASTQPEPSPSASDTPSATEPVTGAFDVSDLPTGSAPGIAWSQGLTIHRADGGTVTVTGVSDILELAPMGDGFVVVSSDEAANLEAVLVDGDGRAGDRFPIDGGLAASPEGSVVGWAAPDGRVTVIQSDGTETFTMPAIPAAGPYDAVAITSEDCKEGRTTPAGCTVLVNTKGERAVVYASTSHGFADRVGGGIRTLTAYRGFYAGITKVDEEAPGTCSDLQDEPGVTRWETCDYRLLGFSPNGEHLVAAQSYGDGYGDTELAILRADGSLAVRLVREDETMATPFSQVWEDDEHVLTATFQEGRWAVVRVGVDGSMEYAVPPVEGEDMDFPFQLQVR